MSDVSGGRNGECRSDDGRDTITLVGLRGKGYHGVLASEREQGQTFTVDLTIGVDTRPAAASDDLTRTVDYSQLATVVHQHIAGTPVALIETLAEGIAKDVLAASELIGWVDVTVHKPGAPIPEAFDDVVLQIRRRR